MKPTAIRIFLFGITLWALSSDSSGQTPFFSFSKYILGPAPTLEVRVQSIDTTSGEVWVNGVDTRSVTGPFHWIWGDGTDTYSWFPAFHTYADTTTNYVVSVISTYSPTESDTEDAVIRFVPPIITPVPLSPVIAVHVPDTTVTLGARFFPPPSGLVAFDDTFFHSVSRSTLEYILSVGATIQRDFVNDNSYLFNAKFEEYLLRDTVFDGAYSLWFTDPVAFGAGDQFIGGTIGHSTFFHEMGHNFTLNTPASYYYGPCIGGCANAIFTESMAQIFQHATGYEVVNNYLAYGLSEDVMGEIKQDAIMTIRGVRHFYQDYLDAGKPYSSWNDPGTPEDDAFGTFMTIAFKFFEHAENAGLGYRVPLKRMMQLLQCFNPDWDARYDHSNNTATADTFRATLMVAAVSYAFSADLRSEFRNLNFPISDQVYNELYGSPLPITLASFTARPVSGHPSSVLLQWSTLSETNNHGFYILRRAQEDSGFVQLPNSFVPGHGTTWEPQYYNYADQTAAPGIWWYRLKQVDLDGTPHYSDPIQVDMLTSVRKPTTPTRFALEQNYPNPFNPTTSFEFKVPSSKLVTLRVYDVRGREVATLVNEQKPPGTYAVQWDANGLASGVYLYRLQSGPFVQTKKCLVLR